MLCFMQMRDRGTQMERGGSNYEISADKFFGIVYSCN